MKKIFLLFLILLFLMSCKKEIIYMNNTELWLKVGAGIDKLELSFVGIDTKDKQHSYVVKYLNNIVTPTIKQITDNKDGKIWVLVHTSLEKSDEIVITYNNKEYKTRGFYLGERRFLEIVLTLSGEVNVNDNDISIIDKIIYIE